MRTQAAHGASKVAIRPGNYRVLKDAEGNDDQLKNTSENPANAGSSLPMDATNAEDGAGTPRKNSSALYKFGNVVGNGSFGVVSEATVIATGRMVAIKRVIQDPKYKNRELGILRKLSHPNIVELLDFFYTENPGDNGGRNRYLNVVMEHIPDNVFQVLKSFVRYQRSLPMLLVKLYTYQLCRSLGYLHLLEICHRDIKPQNLLVNNKTHILKLCDFGSAKRLSPGEASVPYICSRYYRAPELILGATDYTTAIDTWSIGCVLGELLLGKPLFAGETSIEQLVKIIQILGTPTKKELGKLTSNSGDFKFPEIRATPLKKVFPSHVPEAALDLLSRFLKYEPSDRVAPYESLKHPFFDELRDPKTTLSNGDPLPDLFNFTSLELDSIPAELLAKIHKREKTHNGLT